jgi:hypothetical protein
MADLRSYTDLELTDLLKSGNQAAFTEIYERRLSKVMNLYEIPHIPYYLLLDKTGKILASTSDGTIIDDQLKKIYGE